MSSKTLDTLDLRLYGEHINLNIRGDEEHRKNAGLMSCNRPRSALYSSNLTVPDSKRRPFSAGNHPNSLSIQPFLKKAQAERRDLSTNLSDGMNRPIAIPGAADSTMLFNRLLKDPIGSTAQQPKHKSSKSYLDFSTRNFMNYDTISDVSSVETVTSFGTKIKNKAKMNNKVIEDKLAVSKVEGSPLKLVKSRHRKLADVEKSSFIRSVDYDYIERTKEDSNDIIESAAKNDSLKLSIFVPTSNKDENTSSGVSSSSDVQAMATNSPVHHGRPNLQKFTRTRRNISINWFPDANSNATQIRGNVENENFEIGDHTNLKGIVSFGNGISKNEYEKYNEEDDEDYPRESPRMFNTELSLVEEESSQESDASLKISSSIFGRYTNMDATNVIKSNKNGSFENKTISDYGDSVAELRCSTNNNIRTDWESSTSVNIQGGLYNSSFRKDDEKSSERAELEMEERFKELQYKYKVDLEQLNNDQLKSLEVNPGPDSNLGLKRNWTSLESVVSKENDPVFAVNRENYFDKAEEQENRGKNIQRALTETCFHYKSSYPSFSKSVKEDECFSSTLRTYEIEHEDTEPKSIVNVSELSTMDNNNIIKGIPDVLVNTNKLKETNNKTYLLEDQENNIIKNEQIVEKTDVEQINIKMIRDEDYPDYLQTTDVKQYTSKVIEDYKKEIATIDNVHQLTLKDIRSCNKERFDIKNYDKLYVPDKNEPPVNDSRDTLNKDISNFIEEYKNYKLGSYKPEGSVEIENIDSENDEGNETKYTDAAKSKPKKKMKKKERAGTLKYKSFSGNESAESILKKKVKLETKRLTKNLPSKKETTTKVRFKPQKIYLSKTTTNTSKNLHVDKENEIISWMSKKVITSDETSSNDLNETPTPDLIKEKTFLSTKDNIYSSSNPGNSSEAEKHIKPFIRDTKIEMQDYMAIDNNEGRDEVSQESNKDKNKFKEVTFQIDVHTPSIEEDFSLRDWVGNDADGGNELNDLLDDTTMVSNIYSVLKEIEQSGSTVTDESGDKINGNISAAGMDNNAEMKSAEYRDILSYLDNVESKANEDISSLSHVQPPFSLKVEELMELSKGELAHRAVAGALAAGKAGAAAARLRAALVSAANRAGARIKAERLAARQKANTVAQQSAQTITRHQKFIEQLISEKKILAGRIEKMVAAVEAAEARNARAARASADRLQLELKNQRQRLNQAHQRDKQTWLKQHTQKIKDMTIRGLEGEIKELEDKHTSKILNVQKECEDKMLEQREKHSREMRLLKESSTRHLEDQLDRERLIAAERLEQKRVEWESALITATEKAGAEGREVAREARNEVEVWKKQKEKEFEERKQLLEEQVKESRNAVMAESVKIKDNLLREFEKYKEDYRKKQVDLIKEKEAEIRAMTRRERDREIERAIESMEAEAEESRKEMQEAMRKIKAKYEEDMKVLEEGEQSALQRCKEVRELLRDSQESCAQHQVTITQLEGRLRQADELRTQAITEMEISMRTTDMKHKEEIEEMRSQILNLQLQHKDEMHQLYAKVKVAVSKKDDSLSAARREAATLRDRCLRLEARLAT